MIALSVRQPVTVAVGVLLVLLAGIVALARIPVQLTPNVEDTIVAVTTTWEGASPTEIEQEIVDPQEDKLQGLSGLRAITSTCQQGVGTIRLEFAVGTDKDVALRETSDKLREVPRYPANADEPVIDASDPENRDYIAWLVLGTSDPALDVRTLEDFVLDRIKPSLERVPGMAQVNVLGGREREVQVRYDPFLLAQRGIAPSQLAAALRATNQNVSAGALAESKSDVRLRFVGRYASVEAVERTVVAQTPSGPVLVRDVAEVALTFKEPRDFVRSRGVPVIAINAQKEVGANVMTVMQGLRSAVARMNEPGGLLASQARSLGLEGTLTLTQVFDQTIYIDDALSLVLDNIWLGSALAIAVLLLFLRSLRSAGIIALSIPISIVGAVVVMVALGRTVNVISLAGMAFAVGMVVDNAIVVLENVYRHVELGKPPMQAAYDGAREVFGAVLASTLTTVVVFVPILFVEEEAGQLFRDISLAIVAAVSLSLIVSLTVVPCCAARLLSSARAGAHARRGPLAVIPDRLAGMVRLFARSTLARLGTVLFLTAVSLVGTWLLIPPSDYLPSGNRNLVFGLLIPPPGYSLAQQVELAERIEESVRPAWEAGMHAPGTPERSAAEARIPSVPTFDFARMQPGEPVRPPALENYFLVSFEGILFHGGISCEPERVVDLKPLFNYASRSEVAPGVLAFAFQVPLFQLGGATGAAVKINLVGDDLAEVASAAGAVYLDLITRYGVFTVQPDPSNFSVPSPELQVLPDLVRQAELGLTSAEVGLAVQTLGDGAVIGEYELGGDTIDLKLISREALGEQALQRLADTPIATPASGVVPLASVARLVRANAPQQINRVGRRRAITLLFTAPPTTALEQAVAEVDDLLAARRASGAIPPGIETSYTGSASKLEAVRKAMLGDGSLVGTLSSALALALAVVYLLMCILFQSFLLPLIILFSVPLATLGGFAALQGVHLWSIADRYMPVQNLDTLTMLGFVILIGTVVNNAILIVHQSLNFMHGVSELEEGVRRALAPTEAIAQAVRTRVRPIFMTTLTTVGGMAPLVLMPGSGSELYRGLGSVVLGGLVVSTVFTLLLVPLLLSLCAGWVVSSAARDGVGEASASGARLAPVRALALLVTLGALLLTSGCRSSSPAPPVERLLASLAQEQLGASGSEQGEPQTTAFPKSGVASVLAERLDELERLGGPSSASAAPTFLLDLRGEPQTTRSIGLHEAVALASEHNLGLELARLQPAFDVEGVTIAEAQFDLVFFSALDYQELEQPRPVPVLQGVLLGVPVSEVERNSLSAGLRKRLTSGATVSASSFYERQDDETKGIAFAPDPAFRTGARVALTQPLLRGSGAAVNTGGIALGRNQVARSQALAKQELLLVMEAVERAYWDLAESWQRLGVLERWVGEGEAVERVLFERRAFDAEPAQYSDALATVEERRSELVRARSIVRKASDRLKALLCDPALPLGAEVLLAPSAPLSEAPLAFELRSALATAIDERPELRQAALAIADARLLAVLAADGLLPRLDLSAELRVVTEEEDKRSAFEDILSDDLYSVLLRLELELPVGNRAALAAERQARLQDRAALVDYERVLEQVVLDVKLALRDVTASYELLGASRSLRMAQAENLRALVAEEETRGALTPEFLDLKFQRQERLAQAQLDELAALCDYNRARAALYRAMGTGARGRRVVLER